MELPIDDQMLTKLLDRTKSALFDHRYGSFYGALLCSLNFMWVEDIPTAATDGINLMWNPHWFLKLSPRTRVTVLKHEIDHNAKLHFVRMGERHPKIWNYATDIRINNDLEDENYSFEGLENCWKDQSFPTGMPEEDIYDALVSNANQPHGGCWGQDLNAPEDPNEPDPDAQPGQAPKKHYPQDGSDLFPIGKMGPMTKAEQIEAVNNVVRAVQQARMSGAGNVPGDVETVLTKFLTPVVPWEQIIHKFMQDLLENETSWRKPNRRFTDFYLPSMVEDDGLLSHLIYFEDTSGSISDADATRFNSEFKYVKECYRPKKMTLVQFDTVIQHEQEYTEDDPFDQVKIYGRGGTCLECVRQSIIDKKPTAAIVFSDMQCAAMQPLGFEIPIIWVCISNRNATVPFGEIVHIR